MQKQKNCFIGYGEIRSNLRRIISNKYSILGCPCLIIFPSDNDGQHIETNNN